jgi:para-aminobenzoate synthetase/4-amino-4-deoxychorismate lyase
VSASPELFFRLDGRTITCKPMKGTAARGLTLAQDKILRDGLACSIKNRAENVMVADMIRNDLGRIAVPGSVQVESLYDVEKFPTVWQMTSTITAQTDSSITDVFGALFPSASITGAPKKSTLEIIAGIESSPREIYTGAIGYVAPGRAAQFNVAIRTVSIDKHNGSGVCGIGGGIVWDSDAGEEYEECRLKARWLLQPAATKQFRLLESMLWEPGRGIFLPDLHKTRLMRSIEYFDFDVTAEAIDDAFRAISGWSFKKKYKVRLLLTRDGQVELEKTPIPASSDKPEVRLALAEHPVSRNDVFLYHKTTRRNAYARAMQDASGADDVILWNEEGAITETTTCNIVVVIDGKAYTPPVTSGLLAGTYREWLLQNGEIEEREIFLDEISTCDELLVVNSVRRARTGRLIRGRR